ncbi:MAG: PLP-dependent aminotransferase family protein, partial [Ruminococcus sp.]
SFVQAEYVLRSFGNEIFYFESDSDGVTIDSLNQIQPQILLINPNYAGTEGKTMPVARRLEIIEWAAKNNALIIEDDYNGELRYSTHPTPCVQNHGTEQTVYIGSFSKVLLPSVRISYMVLPEKLIRQYNAVRELLNQTASKTEQLALASYIQSGKIDAHIRKARRIYLEKARVMHECLNKYFPGCRLIFNETAMYFGIAFPEQVDRQSIDRELKNHSVRLMPQQHDDNHFGVSFSGIPISKIEEGIALTSRIIHQNTTGKPAAE